MTIFQKVSVKQIVKLSLIIIFLLRLARDPFAQIPKLSVFGVVRRLREQRYYMV